MNAAFFSKLCFCFFVNDTATTEIYTLSLHDALPILEPVSGPGHLPLATLGARSLNRDPPVGRARGRLNIEGRAAGYVAQPVVDVLMLLRRNHVLGAARSEEHTSELQSH